MSSTPDEVVMPTHEELAAQATSLDLERFDHLDAWDLGCLVARLAAERDLACTVAIWRGEQRVFHHARPGTSADNDGWMERKRAVVTRYDAPSLLVAERWRARGITQADAVLGLDPAQHTLSGGGVPVRLLGTGVGVLVVSGLHEVEDHALAVEALTTLRDAQRGHRESDRGTQRQHTDGRTVA